MHDNELYSESITCALVTEVIMENNMTIKINK